MENIHQFPDGFESWIRNKAWSELNAEELKQLQDEQINEDEFLQLKQMLIQLEDLEEEPIQPKDELKNSLLKAFEKGPGKPGKVISLPVWIGTFAAAAAILAFFVWFQPKEAFKNTVADIPKVIQKESSQVISSESLPVVTESSKRDVIVEESNPESATSSNESVADVGSSSSIIAEVDLNYTQEGTALKQSEDITSLIISENDNITENKEIATKSMAQNFSPTSTSIVTSSQVFSSGSTAQNFDQPKLITPNTTLASNRSMLDVLITVY